MQVPFSASSLMNQKESVGSHRDVLTISRNHDWKDRQVLQNTLLVPEEKKPQHTDDPTTMFFRKLRKKNDLKVTRCNLEHEATANNNNN